MEIIFINSFSMSELSIEKPKPSNQYIPEWYKKLESYMSGKKEPNENSQSTNATVKKCIPVFDAITSGYIIPTPCDVWVRQVDGKPYYQWSGFNFIDFHPYAQTEGHPAVKDKLDSPKFMNPWGIKTPKGWSVLFTTPVHRDLPFSILPGIVDTDSYNVPVNFPFRLNDPTFEGLIPIGTPMVQIIPIKRESWKHSIGNETEKQNSLNQIERFTTVFFDKYKRFWWSRKEYR